MNKVDKRVKKYLERAENIMLDIWNLGTHEGFNHEKETPIEIEIAKMIQREEQEQKN